MLEICLSKNIQKSKFHGLTYAWEEWVGKGHQKDENFEICSFYIAKINRTTIRAIYQFSQSIYKNEAKKYA